MKSIEVLFSNSIVTRKKSGVLGLRTNRILVLSAFSVNIILRNMVRLYGHHLAERLDAKQPIPSAGHAGLKCYSDCDIRNCHPNLADMCR